MTEIEVPSLRNRLNSTLTGALILTIAGSLWAIYGAWSLRGDGEPWLAIGLILIALCLFSVGFYLRTKVKQLPTVVASPALQKRNAWADRMFIIVNVIQGIAMFVAANVLINLKMAEYVAPVIALIVGLHFIPLAFSMRVPRHLVLAGLMCLLALVTMLAVPMYAAGRDSTAQSVFLWGIVVGLGSCVILWSGAILRLWSVRKAILAEIEVRPSVA
ncbi:MAG: hypothetical protein M3033_11280 [Acidobacteriota bacterium]|nr:hypothetical protein [Acidobacteriota bacterium]